MQSAGKSTSKQKQHLLFIIAAALAAGGVSPVEGNRQVSDGDVEIPASFPATARVMEDGVLLTSRDYGVKIDRLSPDPQLLELSSRRNVIDQTAARVIELGEVVEAAIGEDGVERPVQRLYGEVEGPEELSLTLAGVQVEGRVFDMGGKMRLPDEGVKITGTLPVDVTVRKEKRLDLWRPGQTETVIAVDFELPPEFFDEVDWEMLT